MKDRASQPTVNLASQLETEQAVEILGALSQLSRLETFRLLVRYLPYGLPAGDIARLVGVPHNTLSTHLSVLEQAGLVRSRREGRSIIYAADQRRTIELVGFLADSCCASTGQSCDIPARRQTTKPFPARREISSSAKTYNVLVLCTGNSSRSILAEAILNKEGQGRIRAFSAGCKPKRKVNPYALSLLRELNYETGSFRSKSWTEFGTRQAPPMDFIITVCDSAAMEPCPHWPGHPLVVHWGLPDPAAVGGTDSEKRAAFMDAYRKLASRITAFVNLDLESLDLASLKSRLIEIGRMEGATDMALRAA